jgi:NAD-dependent SIR2 family protein deacetylase
MSTEEQVLNGGRSTPVEKRVMEETPDLVEAERVAKKRKVEEVTGEEEHRVADPSAVEASREGPMGLEEAMDEDKNGDDMSDEESGDYSFDEMMSMREIPDEKRGDNFEAFVAKSKLEGKHELEVLKELGFKYLVAHLDTNEAAAALIARAIESARAAKVELERQAAEKAAQPPVEAPESPVEAEKPVEAVEEVNEKARSGGLLSALLTDDLDDLDDLDDSDDGSYDPTAAVLDANSDSESEGGDLLTDPVEILGVISSHIRHSEDHMPPRRKLPDVTNEDDAIKLIENAKKIVVLSGAGISVACGVPDFRSPGGLYDQIKEKYNLTDPQLLFDINYIRKDQVPFYDFAAQLFPSSDLKPSKAHRFIKLLQDKGKLLRNYSQNIDTLENQVGISPDNLILCHGSFATFSCPAGHRVDGSLIKPKLDSKHIPQCEVCNDPTGKMFLKPDIVFFGEALPDTFRSHIRQDVKEADLLIVMGSSLRVQPVALVPHLLGSEAPNTPQLLFNRELVAQPHEFDYAFLSDIDPAVERVCQALGWDV